MKKNKMFNVIITNIVSCFIISPIILLYLNLTDKEITTKLLLLILGVVIVSIFYLYNTNKAAVIKLLSGEYKLTFAITVTPIVFLAQYIGAKNLMDFNLNGYILLISALFFTYDGIGDIYAALDLSEIGNNKRNYKYIIMQRNINRYIFSQLITRIVVFIVAFIFADIFKNKYEISISEYMFLGGMSSCISLWVIGWLLIEQKSISNIHNVISDETISKDIDTCNWNEYMEIKKLHRSLITRLPIVISCTFLALTIIMANINNVRIFGNQSFSDFWINNKDLLIYIGLPYLIPCIVFIVVIRIIQKYLFNKNVF